MIKNAAVSVILFKSKTLANGEHPIILRITKNKQRKHISLGVSCRADLWDFDQQTPKRSHPDKILLEKVIAAKKKQNIAIRYLNSMLSVKITRPNPLSEILKQLPNQQLFFHITMK